MLKRGITLLVLALLLTGCSGAPEEMAEAGETGPAASGSEPIEAENLQELKLDRVPRLTFSVQEQKFYTEEKEPAELLTYGYPQVTISLPGAPEVGKKIEKAIAAENDRLVRGAYPEGDLYAAVGMEESLEYAKDAYEERGAYFTPFAVDRSCSVSRGDDKILSLTMEDYMNLGGAHGSTIETSFNYDLKTGKLLSLRDLSEDPEGFQKFLLEKMMDQVKTDPSIQERIDWFEENQYGEALEALLRDRSWKFAGGDLILSSLQYELGAFAAGTVEFRIPEKDLEPWLKEEYRFLPRQEGILILSENTDLTVLDEISYGETGQELFLEARGFVYDLQLTPLKETDDGIHVLPMDPIFYCGTMQDCSLSLRAEVPEVLPNFMVSFRLTDGSLHQGLLTRSGEDGHFFLMNADKLLPSYY